MEGVCYGVGEIKGDLLLGNIVFVVSSILGLVS